MPLHFSREELATRREQVCFSLEQANLYGILIFRQESMFYLTGYDSFGYVFFQCLYLGVNGDLFLLTRSADLRQAQQTSMITDIRIWTDGFGANPAEELRETLREFGCAGKSLGVEYDAYGLTAANGKRLEQALRNFCVLEDASLLVSQLRVVKSPAELSYVRRAAELADDALDEAFRILEPGTDEGELLAVMLSGKRVHHWLRSAGAALPLLHRTTPTGPGGSTHAGVGRSVSTLPRGHDAHDPGRPGNGSAPAHARGLCGSAGSLRGGTGPGEPCGGGL